LVERMLLFVLFIDSYNCVDFYFVATKGLSTFIVDKRSIKEFCLVHFGSLIDQM